MSAIFGVLGLSDTDRSFVNTLGQRVVYDAVQEVLNRHNEDLRAAYSVFVEQTTSDFKWRYKLPGSGYLQRRGGSAQSAAVKAFGSWDVAFPLEDFGAQLADNDIALAYMNLQELNRHLDTITIQDINTIRREILVAMFNNANFTFNDPINGDLTVVPLANGDIVTYPPVIGSDSEATENHYLESGYAASAISDANNPFITIKNELEEHFGTPANGSNIVVFLNNAQTAKVEALTDFTEVTDRFVVPGDTTQTLTGLPANLPGKVLGRVDGTWAVEWRFMPANYMTGLHVEAARPLTQRIDPADTGLGTGLQLVARESEHPMDQAHYRHRFGLGMGNRLNGVVFELGTGGTYTIPTGYSR